jgi:AcrR family transcriptional regulator
MSRPKSERAHSAVLEAATRLFADRGIENTSMDAISEASRVSKATIYKHWADKEALCLDVLTNLKANLPPFDSGDAKRDLVDLLSFEPAQDKSALYEKLTPHFMAYAVRNPDFARMWRLRLMEPPRKRLLQILRRAVDGGSLIPDLNFEIATALLMGPMMYRHVLTLNNQQPPKDLPDRTVDSFWKAHAIERHVASAKKAKRERGQVSSNQREIGSR